MKAISKLPAVFVNHGGGPMPLMGAQDHLVSHMKEVVSKYLPTKPKSIVVLSAHWESDPVKITSGANPSMLYDYYGFPPETYEYQYPAPGSPELASRINESLHDIGIKSELDEERGFDHGVFIPLMVMYPEAKIPVVCVSLHGSLSAEENIKIGTALKPLRDEGVLILGSGYTFHNLPELFHPTERSVEASKEFNAWLKDAIMDGDSAEEKLLGWDKAPGARICHPREEHLLPLFIVAAAGGFEDPKLIFDTIDEMGGHSVSGYLFN